jgi:hypothetical protein
MPLETPNRPPDALEEQPPHHLEAGATIEEIIEQFDITREQISAVLEFAGRSLDPIPAPAAGPRVDAHPL